MSEVPLPAAPGHLSATSTRIWASLMERFEFTSEELGTLRAGLEALDRAYAARRIYRNEGLVTTTSRGTPAPHPAVAIANQSTAVWLKCLSSLGLDPDDADDGTPSQVRRTRSGRFGSRTHA
jgi:phage terminase small subunit